MLPVTLSGDVPAGDPRPSRLSRQGTLQRGALRAASLVMVFSR